MNTLTTQPASQTPAKTEVFGCAVVLNLRAGLMETRQIEPHWIGREAECRYKAMMVPGFVRVEKITPLTQEQFIRAYGDPRRARR